MLFSRLILRNSILYSELLLVTMRHEALHCHCASSLEKGNGDYIILQQAEGRRSNQDRVDCASAIVSSSMAASGDALDALSVAAEGTIVSVGDTIATMLTNPEELIFPVHSEIVAQNAELKRMQSEAALKKAKEDYKKVKMEEEEKKKKAEESNENTIPSSSSKKSRSFLSFRQQHQKQKGAQKTDRVPGTPEKKKKSKPRLKIFNRGIKNKETPLDDRLVITPI